MIFDRSKQYIIEKYITEKGYIEACRDAIYIDSFEQIGNKIVIKGDLNATFCEKKKENIKWYGFSAEFIKIKAFEVVNIDDAYAFFRLSTPSSFTELKGEVNNNENERLFMFETYDWTYVIICADINFSIISER